MPVNTVNISFQDDLLKKIDNVAQEESRSRSELIREAARMYIERREKWREFFTYGEQIQKANKITEKDVFAEIRAVRKSKRKQ
jgi:metal-responsive CopG/Arc/MetJ family transcriptional regulator